MVDNVVASAKAYLGSMCSPANAAIIFDIDDTLLRPRRGLIYPVKDLYDYSIEIGLRPFIVTNREGSKEVVDATHAELAYYGIRGYDTAYFRHPQCQDMWSPKLGARKHIAERGFVTVMSVGDKPWDIGEHGGVGVIIPVD